MCVQAFLERIRMTIVRLIPNFSAKTLATSFEALISRTLSSVRRAAQWRSPACATFLPRRSLSSLFSALVPHLKWAGLQHRGDAQSSPCKALSLGAGGLGLPASIMAMCVARGLSFRISKRGWPVSFAQPVQGQHPSGPKDRSTFDQKRVMSEGRMSITQLYSFRQPLQGGV